MEHLIKTRVSDEEMSSEEEAYHVMGLTPDWEIMNMDMEEAMEELPYQVQLIEKKGFGYESYNGPQKGGRSPKIVANSR